jgi:hypothetical protein
LRGGSFAASFGRKPYGAATGTVQSQNAEMGVHITMTEPSRGVIEAANVCGLYTWPVSGQVYPKIQVITVEDLLKGKRPKMPPTKSPYVQAARAELPEAEQMTLDGGVAE